MQQLGLDSEDEYVERLRGAASRLVEAELRNLLNLVTVTETCFFRDASQFRLLREHIIPTLISERSTRRDAARAIRIWSAGCSSGEEAYSIALTLEDMGLYRACPDWKIDIIGTDLNTKVLEKARAAVYSARAVRNVEGRLLDLHFASDGKTFTLNDEIRKRVKFEFGNLTQTPMPSTGPQDIVFCKNVTIYFSAGVTRKLINGLRDTLTADGYLLLGHAESLWQMSEGFTLVEHERTFCYRKISPATRSAGHGPVDVTRKQSTFVVPTFPPAHALRRVSRAAADRFATTRSAKSKAAPATAASPDSRASKDYDLCLEAIRTGDWDTAETALTALVAGCPTFVPALLLLGGLYVHRGRFEEAIRQADAVLTLTDLEPRAHLLRGMIEARRERTDEALQSLRRALYLDDSLALAHFWLGNLYRDRGDVTRACHEYENVVRGWERHTLELTEEFASDLSAEQLVAFCRESLQRLRILETATANGKG